MEPRWKGAFASKPLEGEGKKGCRVGKARAYERHVLLVLLQQLQAQNQGHKIDKER